MDSKNITLSTEAFSAIEGLQHTCGTYEFYIKTLSRLYNFILAQSDEVGINDAETLNTLRALHFLKIDLACIAGRTHTPITCTPATEEETAERVEGTFAGFHDSGEDEQEETESSTVDNENDQ